MKTLKRRIVNVLLSIMMALQVCNVFAVELIDGIPNEVKSADGGYKQVPVYFNGQQVTEFNVFLRKFNDKGNANELFDISGTATFRVKSYAYKTGSDVKVGTYIECLGTDGKWFEMDWRDREDQISSGDADAYIKGTKDLSVTIKDIQFTMPNQNDTDLRVTFYMKTSTGGEFARPTNKNVQFSTLGKVGITRTVTEVQGEKNVWEVAVRLEGQVKPQAPATDVVLVLDRSGSMNDTVKQFSCTIQEHKHENACYTTSSTPLCKNNWFFHRHTTGCYQKLDCSISEHKHDNNTCYTSKTRASLVKDASQSLVNSLVEKPNVNVSVVSFGGTQTKPGISRYEHFNANWESIYDTKDDNGWYSNYIVESNFTNNKDTSNTAVSKAMGNINGGTPMATGIIKAGLMLKNSSADNRIIILLSDGDPTYMRDGSGPGNRDTASTNTKIDEDTIKAANEAKNKVTGLEIYTIAAGSSISIEGKNVLEKCATNKSEYAYEAADTADALKNVMDSIATNVNEQVASSTTLEDCLADNIQLQLPTIDLNKNAVRIGFKDETKNTTEDVDWSKAGIAITQGSMKALDNSKMVWDIGELKSGTPAVIKYRIYLKSGAFGASYDISKEASFNYLDSTGQTVSNAVPNASVKLSWAKVNVKSYNFSTRKKVENSDFTVWGKVPNNYKEGDIIISSDTKYNTSTAEMDASGNTSIGESVVVPIDEEGNPLELVAIILDGKLYETDAMTSIISRMASRMTFSVTPTTGAVLTNSPVDFGYYYGQPDFSSVTDAQNNFIQPEGVSNISANIKFNTKSKDVSYTVDVSKLSNAKLDGNNFMNYSTSKATVQVKELNGSKRILTKGVDYTFDTSANEIRVKFKNIIDEGVEYKIDMYMPSHLKPGVVYGGIGENTYLKKVNKKTVDIDTLIVAYPKVDEITLETGEKKEVYSGVGFATDSTTDPARKITLTYMEIAKIS